MAKTSRKLDVAVLCCVVLCCAGLGCNVMKSSEMAALVTLQRGAVYVSVP